MTWVLSEGLCRSLQRTRVTNLLPAAELVQEPTNVDLQDRVPSDPVDMGSGAGEGSGAALGAGKGLSLEKRGNRGDLVALHNSLRGGDSPRSGSAPGTGTGAEGTASGWARGAQGGQQQEFPHGKGAQGLEVPRGVWIPIPEGDTQ